MPTSTSDGSSGDRASHTGHSKCLTELDGWATAAARGKTHGGIRTLRLQGQTVTYDLGVAAPAPGAADLVMIDGELRQAPTAEVALFSLVRLREAPRPAPVVA